MVGQGVNMQKKGRRAGVEGLDVASGDAGVVRPGSFLRVVIQVGSGDRKFLIELVVDLERRLSCHVFDRSGGADPPLTHTQKQLCHGGTRGGDSIGREDVAGGGGGGAGGGVL